MKTAIDSAGRLVIPKEIRREANLKPGDVLEIQCREGKIELQPTPLPIRMVRKGPLMVAIPEKHVERLTSEAVESARQSLRRERAERSGR